MSRNFGNALLGCDPEIFLFDTNANKYLSAIDTVGGTKDNPRPIGNGCAVQEDNMAVEYNIPATNNLSDWKAGHGNVIDWLTNNLPSHVDLHFIPTVVFDEDQTKDERAWVFGCDPDYNAYTGYENPKPVSTNRFKRTAGGHIHFGYDNSDVKTNIQLNQLADLILGVPSVLMDSDTERRELYGKAGAHRHKGYGTEYRTLSNFWCKDSQLLEWAFNNSMRVFDQFDKIELTEAVKAMVQRAINTNDKKIAQFLVGKFGLQVL